MSDYPQTSGPDSADPGFSHPATMPDYVDPGFTHPADSDPADPEFGRPSTGLDETADPAFGVISPPQALTDYLELPAVPRCAHLAELLEQFPYSISEALRCAIIAADSIAAAKTADSAEKAALYDAALTALMHASMWAEVAIDEYAYENAPYEYRYGSPAGSLKRCALNALMSCKGRRNWRQKLNVRKAYYERYYVAQFLYRPDNWTDSTTMDGLKRMQDYLREEYQRTLNDKVSFLQDLNNASI